MPKEVTIFSSKEARPYLEKLHFHLSVAIVGLILLFMIMVGTLSIHYCSMQAS